MYYSRKLHKHVVKLADLSLRLQEDNKVKNVLEVAAELNILSQQLQLLCRMGVKDMHELLYSKNLEPIQLGDVKKMIEEYVKEHEKQIILQQKD